MLFALKTNYFLKYLKPTVHRIFIFMNVNKLALHNFPKLSTKRLIMNSEDLKLLFVWGGASLLFYIEKTSINILQSLLFALRKFVKLSQMGLEQHKGEWTVTEYTFLTELSL